MNKTKVATIAVKTAKRYPRQTVGVAKFAIRHRHGVILGIKTTRRMRRVPKTVIVRVSEPGFRDEVAAAVTALGAAKSRLQKVGPTHAVEDKRVKALMSEAAGHLRGAMHEEPKRRSHKLRNLALGGVAVGATGYALLRRRST